MKFRLKLMHALIVSSLSLGLCACGARYEQIPGFDDLASLGEAGDSGTDLTASALTSGDVSNFCSTYTRRQLTLPLNFPRSTENCPWGQGDNLNQRDLYFQSRAEQTRPITLPPGAVICDMRFEFLSSNFTYDDEFVLDYNGLVLASSLDLTSAFSPAANFVEYDWARIRGQPWSNFPQAYYCAGADRGLGTCTWPDTQQQGQFSVSYNEALIHEFSALTAQQSQKIFRFTTTGDNDPALDCRHAPVDIQVHVVYVQ